MNEIVELSKAGQLTGIYFIIICFIVILVLGIVYVSKQNKDLTGKLNKIGKDYTELLVKYTEIDIENKHLKDTLREIKEENKTLQEQLNRIYIKLNLQNA